MTATYLEQIKRDRDAILEARSLTETQMRVLKASVRAFDAALDAYDLLIIDAEVPFP